MKKDKAGSVKSEIGNNPDSEGLVAFAYYYNHFNIDNNKTDKLPNKACTHRACELTWYHCKTHLIIFLKV